MTQVNRQKNWLSFNFATNQNIWNSFKKFFVQDSHRAQLPKNDDWANFIIVTVYKYFTFLKDKIHYLTQYIVET